MPVDHSLVGRLLLSRFRVTGLLGQGGMGAVFDAVDVTGRRPAVVKVLHPEMACEPVLVKRFIREANVAASIESPHVVDVLGKGAIDFGDDGEASFFVMEKLEGPTLAEALEEAGAFPIERAVHVLRQVCVGMTAAHDLHVVHRDLKPDNVVLVSRDGDPDFVKILDFGLSRVDGGVDETQLTQDGQALGTPAYMSPEQAQGLTVDHRTDVYSLGVVAFELLVGALPFAGSSYPMLLLKLITEQPPEPRARRSEIPEGLSKLVLHTLAKQPTDRPTDMRALEAALAAYAG